MSSELSPELSHLPYTEKDIPEPQDAYGISKREAEDSLACIAGETGLKTVILRLPLVYGFGYRMPNHGLVACGPGVKANIRWQQAKLFW